jgi:ATPase family protein associated with various cellular activities (AAA)/ClpA/ClpB-like protein/double zinc ribbon protein
MPVSEQLQLDRFTASARHVLQSAQHQAAQMQAQEVYPEHLLLGVLAQDDDEAAEVLSRLGMNMQVLRAQVASIFGSSTSDSSEAHAAFPLTQEAHACLDWAIDFAEQRDTPLVPSAFVLLSAVRHQRVQPLLALLLSSAGILPSSLAVRTGLAYTHAIDQLIKAKVGELRSGGLNQDGWTSSGIKVERPTITFADILGAETAKQELREVITLLRWPQSFQPAEKTTLVGMLHGMLIVGHPCTERTLLVHATASEAIAPLVSLPLKTLVWTLLGASEREAAHEGRRTIRQVFEQAKRRAPSLLFLNDLDALERVEAKDDRESLLNQVLVELDALEPYPPVVVIATTYKPDKLAPALLSPGRFDRQICLSESFTVHPAAQTKLCLSCKREVLSSWTYCIYCGALLTQACPTCGTPHIEVEGARYCFACGSPWGPG